MPLSGTAALTRGLHARFLPNYRSPGTTHVGVPSLSGRSIRVLWWFIGAWLGSAAVIPVLWLLSIAGVFDRPGRAWPNITDMLRAKLGLASRSLSTGLSQSSPR